MAENNNDSVSNTLSARLKPVIFLITLPPCMYDLP